MVHHEVLSLRTTKRAQFSDITRDIHNTVAKSGIRNGVLSACSLHTTAGMTINENADPSVASDVLWKLGQLVPHQDAYHHAEGNSDSHTKASLVGLSVQVPLQDGRLVLGTWQSVYFCEFDGPRSRRVHVTITGE
ncbi:MAG: YjbQ family protein [Chitinivibrionales bacterium]|nr:YjbQ family protein [Chitinivibrionales bacterium]MBD3395154.1 YjbQ family protein [Chitinivibrionales bacterium]